MIKHMEMARGMLNGCPPELAMKSKRAAHPNRREKPGRARQRGRVLLLEPDHLTRWSVTTYLCRWFAVETVESSEDAARLVRDEPFDALVLSDRVSDSEVANLLRSAADRNPQVKTVRTVTAMSEPVAEQASMFQLEKPFQLSRLAQLLGVAEAGMA
jgi:DNA-binding NtrC family response regulator